MSRRTHTLLAAGACLLTAGWPAQAQNDLTFTIELPDTENWTQVTDLAAGKAFSREWVPAGQTIDNASWLIAQQRVKADPGQSAADFLQMINELSEDACTSTTHDEPERSRIGSIRGVIGRTICAQRRDGPYGTFTDRAVVVEGGYAYIVTSEIRIPPMVVAGVLSFGRNDRDSTRSAAREFMDREERSRDFVRERITLE